MNSKQYRMSELLNWLCDEYGLDTISVGGVVGFVMEMFERGMVGADTLDGISPSYGNAGAAIALVDKMASGEGCGKWLAQGVAAIAERYPAAKPFAMHVKRLEMPAYHPNAAKGTALAYAVSERGPAICGVRRWARYSAELPIR
jgi:aldehyde:ferredoxin oxidoreductase